MAERGKKDRMKDGQKDKKQKDSHCLKGRQTNIIIGRLIDRHGQNWTEPQNHADGDSTFFEFYDENAKKRPLKERK